jgi:2-polyprenyl-3-methyl-5-hydroxy-6-metoxy-1,4-benzoquinol methylase
MSKSIAAACCPNCGLLSSKVYISQVKDLVHGMAGTWNLLECTGCGLIFTDPMIPESIIGDYYPNDYSPYSGAGKTGRHPIFKFFQWLIKLPYTFRFGQPGYHPKPFGEGRLLEVGCGSGGEIQKMSAMGWKCTGVEISQLAVDQARRTCPSSEFIQGIIDDIKVQKQFDLIIMHHVLEHLHRPKDVINTCNKLLRKSGRLVISLPNIGSIEARFFGKKWMGLEIPRHLVHFRESVLENLLVESGFLVLSKRPEMFASSISESLLLYLPDSIRNKISQSFMIRYYNFLFVPLAALSYALGNRGIIEILAEKE